CLHKHPGSRYASAEHLADDLRCWRNGEPIAARPVGRSERLLKWVKRQPAMAGLLATLAAVIVLSFGLVTWQLGQTEEAFKRVRAEQTQREKADRQREKAEQDRARARINAMQEVAPGAVPAILAELEASREDV